MTKWSPRMTFVYLVLGVYGLSVVYPVVLMIVSSFKDSREIFTAPFALPRSWSPVNYLEAWTQGNFSSYFFNSIWITSVSVVLVLALGSLAAYPLGRYGFRGKSFLTLYFLAGLMLPIRLGILPLFFLMRTLGLLNTPWSLVAIYVASGLPFTIFVLSNFFETTPRARGGCPLRRRERVSYLRAGDVAARSARAGDGRYLQLYPLVERLFLPAHLYPQRGVQNAAAGPVQLFR